MAYEELETLETDSTISLGGINKKTGKKNPTSIEGFYMGRKEVPDEKKKNGVSVIYVFKTDAGKVGVWARTHFIKKMQGAKIGAMTLVALTGKTIPTKNNPMVEYSVKQDKNNCIEVDIDNDPSLDTDEGIDEDYNTSSDDENTFEQEELVQKTALSNLERKNKVAALLKRK